MTLYGFDNEELHFTFPDRDDPLAQPVPFKHDSGVTGLYYPSGHIKPPFKVCVVVESELLGEVSHSLVVRPEDIRGTHQSAAAFAVLQAIERTRELESSRLSVGRA